MDEVSEIVVAELHPDPERNREMQEQVRERVRWYRRNEKILARLAAEAVVSCHLRKKVRERANAPQDQAHDATR